MASVSHCLYCFDALASHLERRKPMTLEDIDKSWKEYIQTAESGDDTKATKRIPALQRLAPPRDAGNSGSASSSSLSLAPDTPATSISSASAEEPLLHGEYPLFVTWNTASSSGGHDLRGCIGTFEALDLREGLSSYALTSALEDTRFYPIRKDELPTLQVAVTLLTDFEDCDDAMDWTLGVHGIRISFFHNGRRYGATYLPDVATEQGWTKEETIVSLMRKAGWIGKKNKWQEIEIKCVRYQGKKESLEYDEYKKWFDWAQAKKDAA